ncbi:DUF3482 domain-containing protein [Marinomonas pollencensis]|uniref:Small GTP-binding protein n=1 Tax=Marinomonas pollencensis TaxID=491954 RepID=A0A3E0DID5_9GAMM|nr:DUF3482 domain-containing protein [Marinomonas pollencensis]REG82412.1 small GTP-binding protein [Marinomonas pollencensis]
MSISLLVVGHANTGKTSLIRTLLRQQSFGEISNQAGTTRHVESAALTLSGKTLLTLTDTPGFEDSIGLWNARQQTPFSSYSGADWIAYFCQSQLAQDEFEQEAKILKQLNRCDIILYVVDIRQAPLGKYLDELTLLASASKPIVPILNFSASPSAHLETWRKTLAERHLHAVIRYDSVAFYFEDEKRLYQSIQSLMPDHYDDIESLLKSREEAAKSRRSAAIELLSELQIKAASSRKRCSQHPPIQSDINAFENQIRDLENHFIHRLLQLYAFQDEDVLPDTFSVKSGTWQQDIFALETLKEWGLSTGASAMTGAALGAGIDVMTGGLSLGAAATLGAILGASWQTGRHYKDTLKSKLTGRYYLCVDTSTLSLLCLRGLALIAHLDQRGHASQQIFTLNNSALEEQTELVKQRKSLLNTLTPFWKNAQQHPEWAEQDLAKDHASKQAISRLLSPLIKTNER